MNKFIFVLVLSLGAQAHASFLQASKRYLAPKDMFTLLAQKFPVVHDVNVVGNLDKSCWMLGNKNTNVIGLTSPAIGAPATTQPGAGFVRWWGSCADTIIKAQFTQLAGKPTDEKLWQRFWEQGLLDRIRDAAKPDDPYHKVNSSKWESLGKKVRDNHVRYLIEEWIGPNAVVKDLGFAKGTEELMDILKAALGSSTTMTVKEANQTLILALVLREEFLTY